MWEIVLDGSLGCPIPNTVWRKGDASIYDLEGTQMH